MTIDFTTILKDQDEQPIQDPIAQQANGGVQTELTLGRAVSYALNATFQDEQNLSAEEKFNRGMLAFTVRDSKACDLKAEDIVLIKKLLAKSYSPMVVYRSFLILDPSTKV